MQPMISTRAWIVWIIHLHHHYCYNTNTYSACICQTTRECNRRLLRHSLVLPSALSTTTLSRAERQHHRHRHHRVHDHNTEADRCCRCDGKARTIRVHPATSPSHDSFCVVSVLPIVGNDASRSEETATMTTSVRNKTGALGLLATRHHHNIHRERRLDRTCDCCGEDRIRILEREGTERRRETRTRLEREGPTTVQTKHNGECLLNGQAYFE